LCQFEVLSNKEKLFFALSTLTKGGDIGIRSKKDKLNRLLI